jgi:hypothetical protein
MPKPRLSHDNDWPILEFHRMLNKPLRYFNSAIGSLPSSRKLRKLKLQSGTPQWRATVQFQMAHHLRLHPMPL